MMKYIYFIMGLGLGLMVAHKSYGMEQEQFGLKPIMPQQQLLAQKDALEGLVKNVWENCLKALDNKIPDFLETEDKDNPMHIKSYFEKLPKTDENIRLVKKTVQDVIAKTPILFVKFDKQSKAVQEQALKWMLERMMGNIFIELVLSETSEPLFWCTCTAEYKRITLSILVVNEAREKYPNKNQRIVYTSFASGDLMQDYVVLTELLQSHTNLLANFIDLEYPDIPKLAKKDLDPEEPRDLHMLEMKNKQERAAIIDSFKIKMAQAISLRESAGIDYSFEVKVYQNAYEYSARVQKNPDEKSNIFILVDPSAGSFGMADFPSLANVINVWIDEEKAPVFTLYLPRHHGAHLYELIEVEDEPIKVSPKTMHYLHNQLLSLLVHTGASKNYTPRLVKVLLSKGFLNEKITDEALARVGFPQLMQMRSNLKKQALKDGYSDNNLVQSLTPIKLGDQTVLLSWGTDAHISFQDLVWDAVAPNAIVYQLYAIDPVDDSDANNKIIKVDPEVYKKVDVITPNSGQLSSVKMPDPQEKEEQQQEDWTKEEQEEEILDDEYMDEPGEPEEERYFEPAGLYKRIL